MGDIEKQTENSVKGLREQLQNMPVNMRIFSLCMRSLYSDGALGTSSEGARKFRELRDNTRNDAMVYLKGVLPLSTKLVSSISDYFEYYGALEYEEWREMLSDILEETTGYRELCQTLLQMHEDILVPLKEREDQARVIIEELKHLQEEFERKKKELEDMAGTKRSWAIGLAFIPFVNLIASPMLSAAAESDLADAVAKGCEAKIQEAAAITVSNTLIPALRGFIDGISNAAAFFAVMEQELKKFEGKAEKSKSDSKKLYFKVMKAQARDMKSLCQGFYAVIPAVRTDFLAIPTEGTDQNYIDRWLEKQKKTIQEKCSIRKLARKLLLAITAPDESEDLANERQWVNQRGKKDLLLKRTDSKEKLPARAFRSKSLEIHQRGARFLKSNSNDHDTTRVTCVTQQMNWPELLTNKFEEYCSRIIFLTDYELFSNWWLKDKPLLRISTYKYPHRYIFFANFKKGQIYLAAFDRIALHVTASNFEYYEVLEYKEFRGRIPDILEETISYKELCPTALKMH
ncbi:unnamed protein product [Pocillopora meandrina]|uniref:Uncharacterized protein n=1 Tax=Pocillopora meandrina TaxID=46732 RepID=A0AAU9VT32_9CNID|nr:unnamed protein product [Pocillopora meandrina]